MTRVEAEEKLAGIIEISVVLGGSSEVAVRHRGSVKRRTKA